jgi:flagellar basal body rod protein FlgC
MSDAAFDIAAEGMAAERSAMDVIAQRLATGSAASSARAELGDAENAYVPASFSTALDIALSPDDPTDPAMSFDNGMQWASAADAMDAGTDASVMRSQGATAVRPDGDPIGQMIALVATGRAYDADVAALQAAKQMDIEASDIDKF